jgi:hypothetical protein
MITTGKQKFLDGKFPDGAVIVKETENTVRKREIKFP